MRYEDFVIQLEMDESGRLLSRVLQSPAGEGRAPFLLPFDVEELDGLLRGRGRQLGGVTRDDPETGINLGSDTEAIGSLMVTTVQDRFSIATIVQGCNGLKTGDHVELEDDGSLGSDRETPAS